MRSFIITLFLCYSAIVYSQPTFEVLPVFPAADAPLTLTVDVTGTALEGYSDDVWLWAWLPECSSNCDAPTNVNPATATQDAAKMVRSGTNPDEYSITFTPTVFFEKPVEEITRIGFLLKGADWSNGQTPDDFFEIYQGGLQVLFTAPTGRYMFVDEGDSVKMEAVASESAVLSLFSNGTEVSTITAESLSYAVVAGDTGTVEMVITAEVGGETVQDSFYYIIREEPQLQARPSEVLKGINYSTDPHKVTLALEAPGKSNAYVIGEFNEWIPAAAYQMKKDGDIFWLEISGLTEGEQYAFQYLVDENIKIADPYADLILDPQDDPFISEQTFSGLKTYPQGASGIVAVLETAKAEFPWTIDNFQAPAKEDLVIYELLVRDFDEKHSYAGILDHIDYLKGLGVNAIQLMPVMEFDGNLSWGYNPSFFFASDKFYGGNDNLKTFIDECHRQGIAVILDMVLNHAHEDNPLVQLYWDKDNYKPTADSPWFNEEARHPFNVFYDFNHESSYTQAFVDTVNHYWLEEFRFDGYRFDLTKGFTQDFTGSSDVGAWSSYNSERIALLKRMTDAIRQHHPETYIIFEHLADNAEEKELADYGIMLWGNMNHNFNQLTMGYASESTIDWAYYGTRDWEEPNLIAYMESHDEERLQYRNKTFGNTSGSYSVKDEPTAIDRIKAATVIYYSIPGPKMLWQFGELAYDISIDFNGRTGDKPIPWAAANEGLGYDEEPERLALYDLTASMIELKNTYDVFNTADFTLDESRPLFKQLTLLNEPYTANPVDSAEMNIVVGANFDLVSKEVSVDFPHPGTWYDYFTGQVQDVSAEAATITFAPGEYRLFTDVRLNTVTSIDIPDASGNLRLYPNPGVGHFYIEGNQSIDNIYIRDVLGRPVQFTNTGKEVIIAGTAAPGMYFVEVKYTSGESSTRRLMISPSTQGAH